MFEPIDRVMNMRKGGSAVAPRRTVIGGQDHMLSYITPQEGEILMSLGGSGKPGPMGIPAFDGDADNFSDFYQVTVGQGPEATLERIYIGSEQDTYENRMRDAGTMPLRMTGGRPVPQAANRDEYLREYERRLAALQGRPDPYAEPDFVVSTPGFQEGLIPDPVVPDPVVPEDPSSIVVDPVEVVPELGNIPTFNYQPFVPDFTPPPVLSIEDVLADLKGVPLSSLPTGFAQGGAVEAPRRTDIAGQDHMLSYITPQEGEILMALGGSGEPGPMGIPAFYGFGEHDDASSPGQASSGNDDGMSSNFGQHDDVSSPGQSSSPLGGYSTDPTDTRARATEKDYGLDVFGNPPSGGKMGYAGRFGMSPGRSQAMFGIPGFAGLNVGSQQGYNARMGITDKNPYGKMGLFSSFFGFDPKDVDYTGVMGLNTRRAIANNQFSKFANPQNIRGAPGYNPAFASAKPGTVRAGVQKAGYDTKFGQVVGRNREMSVPEMVARGLFSLAAPGPMGLALSQIGTKEYGLPGLPGMERFGVKDEPPGLVGQMFGALTGGVPADQAFGRAKAAVDDLYGQAKAVVGGLVDSLSPEQIEAVAKATPEQQQEIQENVKSSSTQGFSQPDIFGFSPTTTSSVSGSFSDLTADQKIGVISAEQQARANAAAAGKDISTAGSVARARAIADALRGN